MKVQLNGGSIMHSWQQSGQAGSQVGWAGQGRDEAEQVHDRVYACHLLYHAPWHQWVGREAHHQG